MIANMLQQSLASLRENARILGNVPGGGIPPVTYDKNDPSKTLTSITNRDWARYQQMYQPVENEIVASLRDSSLVTDAREQAAGAFDQRTARTLRESNRYGLRLDPAAAEYQQRVNAHDSALYGDSKVNESRIEQKERNDGLRRALIDIGRGVAGTANSGLGEAASTQAQRNANNIAAKSAFQQQNTQMGAAAAMAALMFL
jgi:hypothetical protein